ncbi:hypothetical protein HU200_043971 [Digitaria exilis]|uniref:Uncharacterized protein n=1 Tax=Digitaria exilis TaxID=1010633 RepID=A0A835EGZ0_9POAL|nr:hypothetical protein HU200_043971 [Digitaria exilis]
MDSLLLLVRLASRSILRLQQQRARRACYAARRPEPTRASTQPGPRPTGPTWAERSPPPPTPSDSSESVRSASAFRLASAPPHAAAASRLAARRAMQARVVVFPVKGRAWCFARPLAPATPAAGGGALPPPTLRDLWRGITSAERTAPEKAESVVDFVADKVLETLTSIRTAFGFWWGMNRAWIGFGSAPEGSMKSRIHIFGLKLLSRVRPSEVLLKSVTKDVRALEIVHPAR